MTASRDTTSDALPGPLPGVCLVGAWPGDPGLITAAGLEAIRRADVVLYDALANPALLAEAPSQAELIDCGKRAKQHRLTQDQTQELMLEKALAGKYVVRLKGGDPYLFGRGAEEVAYLAQHGVKCVVIPGVTSGIAAPAYAGIPVTHRDHASAVIFITGHEDPTKTQTALDYGALAKLIAAGTTACFYMGVGRLDTIAQTLVQHGLSPQTPVAVVQWGTLPTMRRLRTQLASADADVKAAGIGAPSIIVVGAVAGIDEPGLDFFMQRPLFGRRILVTRTRQQASTLREQLEALGASVIEAPTIELAEPESWDAVDRTIRDIGVYDWLVLTSANGVSALRSRLHAMHLDSRHLAGVKIAAIGEVVAHALEADLHIRADLVPARYVAESLAAELIEKQDMSGKRVLLLRADIARPALPRLLTQAGATVTDLVVYHTVQPASLPDEAVDALRAGALDWVTFTSSSTADNLWAMLGHEAKLLANLRIASIGPITSDAVRARGLAPTVEAQPSTIEGLVQAIVGHEQAAGVSARGGR